MLGQTAADLAEAMQAASAARLLASFKQNDVHDDDKITAWIQNLVILTIHILDPLIPMLLNNEIVQLHYLKHNINNKTITSYNYFN